MIDKPFISNKSESNQTKVNKGNEGKKEKNLEFLFNDSSSKIMEKMEKDNNIEPTKFSKKISTIKDLISKMKSEDKVNNEYNSHILDLNENHNKENNYSVNYDDLYDRNDSDNNSENKQKEMRNGRNPMIENFNDEEKYILLLKKKVLRKKQKKSYKSYKDKDVFEKFKEENAIQRRSMRIKINSLKTEPNKKTINNKHKKKNEKKIFENGQKEILGEEILKEKDADLSNSDKNIIMKDKRNKNKKNKDKNRIKYENKENVNLTFSIAEMLRRNREGENVSFITKLSLNDEKDHKSPDDGKRINKNEKNIFADKIKKPISTDGENKNNIKEIIFNNVNTNKRHSKKEKEKINKIHLDEAELLLDDMDIPKSNNIIKHNEIKGSHKNPIKFNKKISTGEVTENKQIKVKADLFDYVKNKINLVEIYKNITSTECTNENPKFDIFSLISFDIENIFNQKLEEEIINNIKINEYSLYEKIYFIYDLIFENKENLEITNVYFLIFAFVKNLIINADKSLKFSTRDIYEIIFAYLEVKINEIIFDENSLSKNFLNDFPNKLKLFTEENPANVLKTLFGKIFMFKENDNVLERILLDNEFTNIQYFFSFNYTILFYFNIENFYQNNIHLAKDFYEKEILVIKNFDFFRLIQDLIMGINFTDKNKPLTELSINEESKAYKTFHSIFELFCLFIEKVNISNLFVLDENYDNNLFNKSNKIIFAESLKEKIFTSNFLFILRKIFLSDIDQINFNITLPLDIGNSGNSDVPKIKDEEIKIIKKQSLVLQIFGNLYLSLISNISLTEKHIDFNFCEINDKFCVLKIVEITQFFELAVKIYKIPLIYTTVFEQILWPEFTKQGQNEFIRRIILYLITILFKFVLLEDTSLRFEQTKNLMNWLYAIVDPKFDGKLIIKAINFIEIYEFINL